jgi:hypothetical protein
MAVTLILFKHKPYYCGGDWADIWHDHMFSRDLLVLLSLLYLAFALLTKGTLSNPTHTSPVRCLLDSWLLPVDLLLYIIFPLTSLYYLYFIYILFKLFINIYK